MTAVKLKYLFGLLVVVVVVRGFDYSEEFSDFAESDGDWNLENLKVAGGDIATIEKFAYQALIKAANSNASICAGAIISTTWVITAAHCINTADITNLVVRVGTAILDTGGTVFNVSRVVIHSLFNATTNNFDYGLIQINGSFTFGATVNAILLPPQNSKFGLYPLTVTGWGLITSAATAFSNALRVVNIAVIPNILCRVLYGSRQTITDTMFCAGKVLFGGKGACQGDTGGPVVNNKIIVGIATMGLTCGDALSPSVFARVSIVTSWIQGITGISVTG